ncbi:MAG: glycosyltransferase family 4 protein [Saprospiraceae bacterium]|nr:glycosyltransferase family 4 protein [Saprospiraceae bacterium]MDW8482801.1 glycosyltransferase family 4 protein [Saprospiraceae bacterium]
MRVLHLFDYYLPTTLNWVSYLLQHLKEVQLEIGAPWIIEGEFWRSSFRAYRYPFQVPGLLTARSEADFPLLRKLFSRSQRILPTYAHWLAGRLSAAPPDILHAHFGPVGCLYASLARRLRRPMVVTFYGFDYERILRIQPALRQAYQRLFDQAARLIVASPFGSACLNALGCPLEKIAIVPPSPDLSVFLFQKKAKPIGRLHLVQAATFTPKKGHLTTLEAVRIARSRCPGLRLTLAGERYDLRLYRQVLHFLDKHQLRDWVTILGPVAHRQMPAFLARFDAFIHPSQRAADGDHEASPVALLEAQATGLPVLGTRHADLPLLVAHEQTGLLVEEGDAQALAEAIQRFHDMESSEYEVFAQSARSHVEKHYDVRRSAELLKVVYKDLA